jgi:Cdc6-like AAA superfamily ATPase
VKWLNAPDVSVNHNNAAKHRHGNSGNWIFSTSQFAKWQQGRYLLLWIHGIPGCGKSVLLSTVIKKLKADSKDEHYILYFYFDTQDERKQSVDQLARALLVQLCLLQQTKWSVVEEFYRKSGKGTFQPSTKALQECFLALSKDRQLIIALDALDECPIDRNVRNEVTSWITEILQARNIRIVMTSRPECDIQAFMDRLGSQIRTLNLSSSKSLDADIEDFLKSYIYDKAGDLARWKSRPNIQEKIEKSLAAQADGM